MLKSTLTQPFKIVFKTIKVSTITEGLITDEITKESIEQIKKGIISENDGYTITQSEYEFTLSGKDVVVAFKLTKKREFIGNNKPIQNIEDVFRKTKM